MSAVARLGDTSSHGGTIISASSNTNANGRGIARNGDQHRCGISSHGVTPITAITTKTFVNGRLVVTVGAVAGCGAVINSGSPNTNAE